MIAKMRKGCVETKERVSSIAQASAVSVPKEFCSGVYRDDSTLRYSAYEMNFYKNKYPCGQGSL